MAVDGAQGEMAGEEIRMNWDAIIESLSVLVWPLIGILFGLLILKQLKDDVRPIFLSMVGPLAKQAQTNAIAWATGIMLGVLSSLGALTEVAAQMKWVWVGILCKVLGPGLATIVALIKQSPVTETSGTPPPFTVVKPPPPAQPPPA